MLESRKPEKSEYTLSNMELHKSILNKKTENAENPGNPGNPGNTGNPGNPGNPR